MGVAQEKKKVGEKEIGRPRLPPAKQQSEAYLLRMTKREKRVFFRAAKKMSMSFADFAKFAMQEQIKRIGEDDFFEELGIDRQHFDRLLIDALLEATED